MTTLQCQFCKQSIKDVTWDKAWNWLETHECKNPKKIKKAKK